MSADNFKLLFRADSIIQRDAILAELRAAEIEAFAPHRDISRKVTESTVDLAYEGYSAIFEGFEIQVRPEDIPAAKAIVESVLVKAKASEELSESTKESRSMQKFYFCALFSSALPLVMHIVAIQHLIRARKNREPVSLFYFAISVVFLIGTGAVGIGLLKYVISGAWIRFN